jgi:hypothetical protein
MLDAKPTWEDRGNLDIHVSTMAVKLSMASGVAVSNPSCFSTMAIDRCSPCRASRWYVGADDSIASSPLSLPWMSARGAASALLFDPACGVCVRERLASGSPSSPGERPCFSDMTGVMAVVCGSQSACCACDETVDVGSVSRLSFSRHREQDHEIEFYELFISLRCYLNFGGCPGARQAVSMFRLDDAFQCEAVAGGMQS